VSIPLCNACPISDRCFLRLTRSEDKRNIPEPELRMLELRKRDESELTELVRNETFVVRQGAFKAISETHEITELVAAGELFGPEIHFKSSPDLFAGKSLMPEITVCTVPSTIFERWMGERPALNRLVLQTLAQRNIDVRIAYHWARKTLRERAIMVLYHLRERFGVRYGQFRMIDVPLTKIDLASLMSTVQESAVRVLSEFREDGLISANGKRIVILDNDRLNSLRQEILVRDREMDETTVDESLLTSSKLPLRPRTNK